MGKQNIYCMPVYTYFFVQKTTFDHKETLFLALAQRKIKVYRSPNIENQTEKPCSNDGVCSMKLLTLKLLDHCSGKPFIYSLISVH